jgi:putative sigma-54 modulation protein
MQVSVTFRNTEATEALKRHVEEKVQKLRRFLDRAIEAHVVLSIEKFRHIADVTLLVGGVTLKAEEVTEDMYSAIDLAMEKIERQVRRYKEKITGRKHNQHGTHALPPRAVASHVVETNPLDEVDAHRIVRTENYFIKPMSVEEAAMQLDLINNDFLVFTDAQSQEVKVLYRRKDGNYGLIETGNR